MERLSPDLDPAVRRSCQRLLYGSVRHLGLIENGLNSFLKKKPRPGLQAHLVVASFELMSQPERRSQVVDHAVSQVGRRFSKAEAGLTNAVLRKMADFLPELLNKPIKTVSGLAQRFSHPDWLVERWVKAFGFEDTEAFLTWNQKEPLQYVFTPLHSKVTLESTDGIVPSRWPGHGLIEAAGWSQVQPHLKSGDLYLQNPGAAYATSLIAEVFQAGKVLDLCAAPGGKSLMLEKKLEGRVDEIVVVDLPGPRFQRMEKNFKRCRSKSITSVAADLRNLDTKAGYQAVLLDTPCSNSGVLQRKVDAKWRLTPEAIEKLPALQLELLQSAARHVAQAGVLVYSTCSIDASENEKVVDAFLGSDCGSGFSLEKSEMSYPWKKEHDGSGAFLLRKG